MNELKDRVLQMFSDLGRESLDLHALFEAAGNDQQQRAEVLHAIEELSAEGFLEARGSDFYELTEKGRLALTTPNPLDVKNSADVIEPPDTKASST